MRGEGREMQKKFNGPALWADDILKSPRSTDIYFKIGSFQAFI